MLCTRIFYYSQKARINNVCIDFGPLVFRALSKTKKNRRKINEVYGLLEKFWIIKAECTNRPILLFPMIVYEVWGNFASQN